jgi:dimethylhistidine N-methyltransferase
MKDNAFDPLFADDVLRGLSAKNKHLFSRYFYDATGDSLFQAIMASPEYYLTNCEHEIFAEQGIQVAEALATAGPFELDELGSGDGLKTRLLLDALHTTGVDFTYRPIDISANSLELLSRRLCNGRPWLKINAIHGDYMQELAAAQLRDPAPPGARKVIMFLGSNLGNYTEAKALDFLKLIRGTMRQGDALLIGLDLQKEPAVIRAAYNDAGGHTREFNLNLLVRINRELGGDFDLSAFEHTPEYDEATGAAKSYLKSTRSQSVYVAALDQVFSFAEGETIFMEISQKYNREQIASLALGSGFKVQHEFFDSKHYFTDQVWSYAPSAVFG